jgi:hypothetical protein
VRDRRHGVGSPHGDLGRSFGFPGARPPQPGRLGVAVPDRHLLHPALERARSAHLQVWSWLVGTVVMAIGVGLVHTGTAAGEPLAAGGSLIVFASALLFAWLLFRTERADASVRPAAAPAE